MYQDGRWLRSISEADAPPTAAAATAAAPPAGRAASKGLTNLQLSSALKAAVQEHASLDGGLTLQSVSTARDGTHK
jgi:hypothetical protein